MNSTKIALKLAESTTNQANLFQNQPTFVQKHSKSAAKLPLSVLSFIPYLSSLSLEDFLKQFPLILVKKKTPPVEEKRAFLIPHCRPFRYLQIAVISFFLLPDQIMSQETDLTLYQDQLKRLFTIITSKTTSKPKSAYSPTVLQLSCHQITPLI